MPVRNGLNKLQEGFYDALKDADDWHNAMEACGGDLVDEETGEELQEPYAKILEMLEAFKSMTMARKSHEHQWDENGLCSICGRDGNA